MTPRAAGGLATVDLSTCATEPIHIPGQIQPHGVLLAFDLTGRLTHASRNAPALFPDLPVFGLCPTLAQLGSDPVLHAAITAAVDDAAQQQDGAAVTIELSVGGSLLDVVIHAFDGRVIVEFERRGPGHVDLASFALMAHRSMARLRKRRDIPVMLEETVAAVRALTGFDRVMAYRFHHDDSGEVVAELCRPDQSPYLGMRFPASDIPVQARRLYTLNTLRLIADAGDLQVTIDGPSPHAAVLDLSHAVLRSVSPIHIEYLKNIGVAASMSLSILVNGRLWALIACHHGTAHRVPYALRMACDVLAQMVSSSVQSALDRQGEALREAAAEVRARLVEVVLHDEDLLQGFAGERVALRQVVAFDGVLSAYAGRFGPGGPLELPVANRLLNWLGSQADPLISIQDLRSLPPSLRESLMPWCGMLALCFDRTHGGWIVLLRREQVETVTWNGPVDKVARMGPMGARLTPDGSLAEWRQLVEGTSLPWDEAERTIGRQLLDELSRAASLRRAETDRARTQLLMVLGHDLRDPLHSISMAARVLGKQTANAPVAQRITVSTGRMERLVSQVLDVSLLHGGLGLSMNVVPCDLAELLQGMLDEFGFSYPDIPVEADLPCTLLARADVDRLAQLFGNLMGNARQHGVPGEPILLSLAETGDRAVLTIANAGTPLPLHVVERLFEPLKAQSRGNPRNPNGLGLGLFIASEIAKGHGGTLCYGHDGTHIGFTASLPCR